MTKQILRAVLVLELGACPAAATVPVHSWSRAFSKEDSYGTPMVLSDTAVDGFGNVIVAGTIDGAVDFGGGPLTSADGNEDMFVAKFNADGVHVWSRLIGGSRSEYPSSVATDDTGNIVISGGFEGTVDFGGVVLTNPELAPDVFIAKLGPDGQTLWARSFPVPGPQYYFGLGVSSDHILVSCRLDDGIDFGGGYLDAAVGVNLFVARLDGAGNHVWSRRFIGTSFETYPAGPLVVEFESGEFLLTGSFEATLDFGNGVLTSAGARDIYVARFTADGICTWSERFGDASTQNVSRALLDGAGCMVMAGTFEGSLNFGGGALVSAGGLDIFLAKLDGAGGHLWSRRFGDSAYDYPGLLFLDDSGNQVMVGARSRAIDFGGGPMVPSGLDIYMVQLDPFGDYLDGQFFSGSEYQSVTCGAVGPDGSIVVGGLFQGSVDFGGGPLTVDDPFGEDMFLVRFVPQQSVGARGAVGPAWLRQNYPNPFNPTTTIEYTLAWRTAVVIEIFDAAGGLVVRFDEGTRGPGLHAVQWNGRDATDSPVASGVYFCRLTGEAVTGTRKMVLVK